MRVWNWRKVLRVPVRSNWEAATCGTMLSKDQKPRLTQENRRCKHATLATAPENARPATEPANNPLFTLPAFPDRILRKIRCACPVEVAGNARRAKDLEQLSRNTAARDNHSDKTDPPPRDRDSLESISFAMVC
jgi:hypothetical protein